MAYKYVRKSTRQSWKQDDMQHAIEEAHVHVNRPSLLYFACHVYYISLSPYVMYLWNTIHII